MTGPTLSLVQGTSRDFRLQAVRIANGAWSDTDPSPFLDTDTLVTSVWAGHAQPVLMNPTTTWVDSAAGTFQVSFSDLSTATTTPGRYRIQTTVARTPLGGPKRTVVILDGWFEITAAPGSEVTRLAFTHYDDLLQYAAWLTDLQTDQDEEAFAHQQSRATNRLIDMLVMQWKPDRIWPRFGNAGAVLQWTVGWPSMPPSYWLRQQIVPLVPGSPIPASMPARFSTIPNFVDPSVSTCLLLYDEVKEIAAKLAIAIVCEEQIGRASGGETYREIARRYRREANTLYRARRFELDLGNPQTGYTWFSIKGGATNLR